MPTIRRDSKRRPGQHHDAEPDRQNVETGRERRSPLRAKVPPPPASYSRASEGPPCEPRSLPGRAPARLTLGGARSPRPSGASKSPSCERSSPPSNERYSPQLIAIGVHAGATEGPPREQGSPLSPAPIRAARHTSARHSRPWAAREPRSPPRAKVPPTPGCPPPGPRARAKVPPANEGPPREPISPLFEAQSPAYGRR